jgi:hemerythrin superfamily protein
MVTGPDIFALLSDDHRKAEQLFEQCQQTNDPAVVIELCDELTAHAMAEEEMLYGVVATKLSPGRARDARSEHAEAKRLIGEIEAALSSGGDIAPIVGQLQETMQHHVQEEESEIFPLLREKVPTAIGEMGLDFLERKKVLLSQVRDTRDAGAPSGTVSTTPPTAGIT